MNETKPKSVFLILVFMLLILPAFGAAVSFQLGDAAMGIFVYFTREVLWLSFAAIFVGVGYWQVRVSRFALPALPSVDFLLLVALLILSIALSQFVSPSSAYALNRLWVLVLMLLVGYASFSLSVIMENEFSHAIYKVLIGGILLHIPFIFLQIYLHQDTENFPWTLNIPGWRGVRPYNYFVEVGVAVGVGMLVIKDAKERGFGIILLGAVSICWAMLIWGGGRGAIVGLLGALLVSSVLLPHLAIKLWKISTLTFAIGAVLSLLIWIPDSPFFGLTGMLFRSSGDSMNTISSNRIEQWQNAVESIKGHPFFGYGLGQSIYLPSLRTPTILNTHFHVHNIVLEVVLSWGFIGATLFTALFARTCGRVLARVRAVRGGEKLPALLPLLALLGHGLFSGTYFHIHSLIYIAIFFGICLAPNSAQNGNTNG